MNAIKTAAAAAQNIDPEIIKAERLADLEAEYLMEHWSARTHNGMITLENRETGVHKTFKISRQKDAARFAPGKRIVSLLTGPDRENSRCWKTFAFADEAGVNVFRKLRGSDGQKSDFEKFARILDNPREFIGRLSYTVEGRCRSCNRPLTNPASLRSGVGPDCEGRANQNVAGKLI